MGEILYLEKEKLFFYIKIRYQLPVKSIYLI